MLHARPRAHALHIPWRDDGSIAHAVLVLERTFEHIAQDLHVAMTMRRKAPARLHAILVDDA